MSTTQEDLIMWHHEQARKLEYQYQETGHITYEEYREKAAMLDEEFEQKLIEAEQGKHEDFLPNVVPFKKPGSNSLPWYDEDLPPTSPEIAREEAGRFVLNTVVGAVVPREGRMKNVVILATPIEVEAGNGMSFLTSLPLKRGSRVRVTIEPIGDRRDSAA